MNKTPILVSSILALLIGLGVGYWYGDTKGYNSALSNIKATQELAAKKASEEAAESVNPFKTVNPLEGVGSADPFAKAKKVLNPF